jgi:NADP-dependent aldehyde dehydrogenase
LRAAAEGINHIGDELVEMATTETGLPEGRIRNETARTVGQLSLFADVADSGTWLDARIDTAPGKPDVRR